MSQHNAEGHTNLQSSPTKNDEEFPWFTVIMMALCLIMAIILATDFIVTIIKHGH